MVHLNNQYQSCILVAGKVCLIKSGDSTARISLEGLRKYFCALFLIGIVCLWPLSKLTFHDIVANFSS